MTTYLEDEEGKSGSKETLEERKMIGDKKDDRRRKATVEGEEVLHLLYYSKIF